MSKTKDFFSYFWQTIKKAKYLIIKGVVIAVLYTVISVLANLLEVEELTYLNALLALNYSASMISFGVSLKYSSIKIFQLSKGLKNLSRLALN